MLNALARVAAADELVITYYLVRNQNDKTNENIDLIGQNGACHCKRPVSPVSLDPDSPALPLNYTVVHLAIISFITEFLQTQQQKINETVGPLIHLPNISWQYRTDLKP